MQEYGELDAKDYIPGAEILEVKKEENAAEDEGSSFISALFLTKSLLYCTDLEIFMLFEHLFRRCLLSRDCMPSTVISIRDQMGMVSALGELTITVQEMSFHVKVAAP